MFGTPVEKSRIHRHGVRSQSLLQRPSDPATCFGTALPHAVLAELRVLEHPEHGDPDQRGPPARNTGGPWDREHRDNGRTAVPLCQRLPAVNQCPCQACCCSRGPGMPAASRRSSRWRTDRWRRKAHAPCHTGKRTPFASIHGDRLSGPALPNASHPIGCRRTGTFRKSRDVTPRYAIAGARPVAAHPQPLSGPYSLGSSPDRLPHRPRVDSRNYTRVVGGHRGRNLQPDT